MNVFDASAVLALLDREPGAAEIATLLEGSLISAVNLAEVLQKAEQWRLTAKMIREDITALGLGIVAFDDTMALDSAELWVATRPYGLSLGDRACLALTIAVGGVAITTDTAWGSLSIDGIGIHVVRR